MFSKFIGIIFVLFCSALALADATLDQLGGHVKAEVNGETLLFPTLKTDIKADVQGDLATVTVRQSFANPLTTPLHVTYLFPLSKDAAVFEMIMEVGDERIRADIQRVEQARATFQKAKREGRSAALLSQHRPNMFTQDIANLMPGLPIHVTLRYVQTVNKVDGDYELVIPLVVGPRFQPHGADTVPDQATAVPTAATQQSGVPKWDLQNPPEVAGGADKADSSTTFGQWELQQLPAYPPVIGMHIPADIDPNRVSLQIQINAGMPIQGVSSSTHSLDVQSPSEQQHDVTLAEGHTIDNRDFMLRYRLAGSTNQAGLLAYRDQRGGFFSLLLEPPKTPSAEVISQREIVFVLDCSGSMNGLPIEASKAFARTALSRLRSSDKFRIIRFSDKATEFSQLPLSASAENIQRGITYLNGLRGSGGTVMSSGITQALSAPIPANTLRLVVFLTDGYIGNEYEVLKLINRNIADARLFSFGVGTSVNRFLLSEMARIGRGFVRYMDPTETVDEIAEELAQRLQAPVLTDIRIDWGELQAFDIAPQPIPDLFAGQSLRLMGRYQMPGEYKITVHGEVNGQPASLPLKINLPEHSEQGDDDGDAIPLIWARSAIKQAMHQFSAPPDLRPDQISDDALKQQVVKLGLDFSLVTQWTAFVAVSEKIYNQQTETTPTLPVPLAKVKGVTELAYGEPLKSPLPIQAAPQQGPVQLAMAPAAQQFHGNAAPEPGFIVAVLLLILLVGFFYRQQIRTIAYNYGNVKY